MKFFRYYYIVSYRSNIRKIRRKRAFTGKSEKMGIGTYYAEALQTAKKFKNLLVFFVLPYGTTAFGRAENIKNPVLRLQGRPVEEIQNLPHGNMTGALADSLALKILTPSFQPARGFFFDDTYGACVLLLCDSRLEELHNRDIGLRAEHERPR
jgi:hypothetical protein